MCWSKEISLGSFVIGIAVSMYLFKRRCPYDIMLGTLIFFYSFVQLIEFFMWKSIEGENTSQNVLTTKLIYYALCTHLFALGLGLFAQYPSFKNAIPMIAGLIIMLYGLIKGPGHVTASNLTPTSSKHIVWGFNDSFYIFIIVGAILTWMFFTDMTVTWPYMLLYAGTFVFTLFTNKEAMGSMWCWEAAFLSIVTLMVTCKK